MISPEYRNFGFVLFLSVPVPVAMYLIVDNVEITELFDFLTQSGKYKMKVLADSVSSDKSCHSPGNHRAGQLPLSRHKDTI